MISVKQDSSPLKKLILTHGRNPYLTKNIKDHDYYETIIEGVYFDTSEVVGTKPDHKPIKVIGLPEAIAYGLIAVEDASENGYGGDQRAKVVHILNPDVRLVIGLRLNNFLVQQEDTKT